MMAALTAQLCGHAYDEFSMYTKFTLGVQEVVCSECHLIVYDFPN